MTKFRSLQVLLGLAAGLYLGAATASGEEHFNPPAFVIRYCSGCHGIDGKSPSPLTPQLAGLDAAYTERKLANFRAAVPSSTEALGLVGRGGAVGKADRSTSEATAHLVGAAQAVSDGDLRAAALWYAGQHPAPGKSGKRELLERGKNLYINGVQSQGVPACQSCHGPEAQGTDIAPRLAGQNAAYLVRQLVQFRRRGAQLSPMTEVARSLEKGQAPAVAAYLQAHQ